MRALNFWKNRVANNRRIVLDQCYFCKLRYGRENTSMVRKTALVLIRKEHSENKR